MALPSPNPIPNTGDVTYNYTVDPSVPNGASGANASNTVDTQVNTAVIDNGAGGLNKSVDKAYAQPGDTLTYTIALKNTGNVTADNVIFTDTTPNDTTFVPGSLTINGTANPGDPNTGVNVGNISGGGVTTISYKVVVAQTLPNPNPIPNSGDVGFTYTVDPSVPDGSTGTGNSNIVNTQINKASINNATGGLNKSVDKPYANVGDTLTYTLTLQNTGNVTATNVIFKDTIPTGTTFVANSLTVNGTPNAGNPQTGVNVGNIGPGAVTTVSFKVIATTIPNPNPVLNSGGVNFTYTVDPSVPNGATGTGISNIVPTTITNANIVPKKAVDKAYADIGDTLTYTITLQNSGNVPADNVVISDTVPNDTTFIPGSVTVNGAPAAGNPAGINVGSIAPNSITTITFQVVVNTIPNPNPIPNSGTYNFVYTTDPLNPNGNTGAGNTNIVKTQVNHAAIDNATGGLNKTVNKQYAQIGDTLTYSVGVKNTGNATANNVIITDTIPTDTTFVANSVTVNGVPTAGNPQTGVNVGSIGPNAVKTVTFQVTVNTFPNPNPIPNDATANFTYTVDPSVPNGATGAGNSNQVNTQINEAIIQTGTGILKGVDLSYAQIGDTLTYTTTLQNTGNVPATNVTFKDTLPNGTAYIPNTLTVDGTPVAGSPTTGVPIGTINPGQIVTIMFQVTVTTFPTPNPIPNISHVNYNYAIDPAVPNGGVGGADSNKVLTKINEAIINNPVKTVDKTYANVGDTLTYTVAVKNTGNTTADNVIFTDTIPTDTTLVPGSLTVNGVANPGDPGTGINIGTVGPGSVTTITYKVVVGPVVPNPNPIPNSGNIVYNYTIDPSVPDGANAASNTNIVNTQVNHAQIDNSDGGLQKQVDKIYANVGDTLTYTVQLENTGNVTANNVVFKDTIPSGTTFVPNSVTVNGAPNPGNPGAGINVGNIGPGAATIVTFQVVVNTIPNPNPIPNSARTNFTYTVNPAAPNAVAATGNSNIVETTVSSATIKATKATTKAYADFGDTYTYTIVLQNTGNVTADNVLVSDTIPVGATFIANSATVNGIPVTATPGGINVGSIAPGAFTTVTFDVAVTTLPTPNPMPNSGTVNFAYTIDPASPDGATGNTNTNIVNTLVSHAAINNATGGLNKTVDKPYAQIGDTLTYTVVVKNTGNTTANNVIITDTIPNDTTFVPGSVTVNGVAAAGNPQTGINVGSVGPSAVKTITFKVVVNTFPNPNPIPNDATSNFTYTVNPSVPNGVTGKGNSNTVDTQVNEAIINNAGTVKSVDLAYAQVGDVLTYTTTVQNTGNVPANNVVFRDTIPSGTTFIPGSLSVDGTPTAANPQNGVPIGTIAAGQTVTIKFQVTVNTFPTPNPIPNTSHVDYHYTIDPAVPNGGDGASDSNKVTTTINEAFLGKVTKSVDKSYADLGDTLTYTISFKNVGNTTANNVVFIDTIPTDTTLVPGSLTVNGVANAGDPGAGVNIGSVGAGKVTTISFKVVVGETIPTTNPIPNNGSLGFVYTVDPSVPDGVTGGANTNTVNTKVNSASINNATGGLNKSVDKPYAQIGDTLTYTLTLQNTGNAPANNVIVTDTIPNQTTFVPNSFTADGVVYPGSPATGVNIGTIQPGQVVIVTFMVTVNTFPNPNPIPNQASTAFRYTIDPSVPNGGNGKGISNVVDTTISQAIINNGTGIVKSVNKANADIGDTITYTISLKNTGNTTADNVVLSDTVPNDTAFVPGSITVNGVPAAGNPAGVNVGSIGPNEVTTVTFSVLVLTMPTPNPIPNSGTVNFDYTVDPALPDGASASGNSNIVNTQINHAQIDNASGGLTKSVNKVNADFGDTLTYTLAVTNTGNVTANNVIVMDTIPTGTTFIANSVTVNGTAIGGNPGAGVNIGNVGPGATSTVTFKVVVNQTLPNPNPIPNNASVKFTYTADPSVPNGKTGTGNSNTVNTQVNHGSLGTITKTVDKPYAKCGDILTYTISVPNTGNIPVLNVLITDTLPNNTQFISNSVTVNGVNVPGGNPAGGVNVGNVDVGMTTVLTYQVRVICS